MGVLRFIRSPASRPVPLIDEGWGQGYTKCELHGFPWQRKAVRSKQGRPLNLPISWGGREAA